MEENGGVSIEGEDHQPVEYDDHAKKNTFEDDAMNALIHDTFSTSADDDDNEDEIEVIHYIPLLEKENTSLYEGFQSTLLFVVFLLVINNLN